MLPDTSDLIQAFLIPAVGAGVFRRRKGRTDDELKAMLDGFRQELRAQFDADRERQKIARGKLEALAAEWAPRVTSEEAGVEIADMMSIGIVAPLAQFVAERKQDRELLKGVQAQVIAVSGKGRPSVRPYALGWVDDGRRLADENIETLEDTLKRARQVEGDFRVGRVESYIRPPENCSTASFEEQMAVAREIMVKRRSALRELAK